MAELISSIKVNSYCCLLINTHGVKHEPVDELIEKKAQTGVQPKCKPSVMSIEFNKITEMHCPFSWLYLFRGKGLKADLGLAPDRCLLSNNAEVLFL